MTYISVALKLSELIQNISPPAEESDYVAIAYTTRNRMERGGCLDDIITEARLTEVGQNSCQAACSAPDSILRSLSIVSGVFAGLYEDPTRGATRFHRHDETPSWAEGRPSNALLGPYIYYGEENT